MAWVTSIFALGRRDCRPCSRGSIAAAAFGILLAGTGPSGPSPAAAEEFRRLGAAEIRSRIVGRDITDDYHWSEYYRRDGALITEDLGRSRTGRWSIDGDMLCTVTERAAPRRCWQIWAAGSEVSFRERPQDRPPIAYIRPHQGR